jgi:hypothetical protein
MFNKRIKRLEEQIDRQDERNSQSFGRLREHWDRKFQISDELTTKAIAALHKDFALLLHTLGYQRVNHEARTEFVKKGGPERDPHRR